MYTVRAPVAAYLVETTGCSSGSSGVRPITTVAGARTLTEHLKTDIVYPTPTDLTTDKYIIYVMNESTIERVSKRMSDRPNEQTFSQTNE